MNFPVLSFTLFAATMAYTPGPNNTMLAISGANFGFRSSVPHILGVGIGFGAMAALMGIGLAKLLEIFPPLLSIMNLAGLAFVLWFAWQIASSPTDDRTQSGKKQAKPMSFMQAAMFQWVNGKALLVVLGAFGKFLSYENYNRDLALACLVFVFTGLTSASVWTLFGTNMNRFLNTAEKKKVFNITMSLLLLLSLLLSYI